MKKHHKYMLDAVMTVIMVLLMKIVFTGLLWHEILGLGVFFLFLIHNIINFNYLKCILKKFSSDCVKLKVKAGILLDILLSLVVTGIVITGIMVSKEIFPFGLTGTVSSVHHSLSYLALILISVHVGLHWLEIMGAFRKIFKLENLNKARTYFLRVVTLFIVFFGIKGSFNQDVAGKLIEFSDDGDGIDVTDIKTEGYSAAADEDDDMTEDEDDDDEDDKDSNSSDLTVTPVVSLEEYLNKLHCDGCRKHCPLSAPQCGIGQQKALEATESYNASKENAGTSETVTPDTATKTTSGGLEDYLSKLFCNGCSRHCPLSAPQCGVGEQQSIEATNLFYADEASGEVQTSIGAGEVLTDFLPMMGMYIAGTHYLVMIPKYLKDRERD